MLTPNTLSYCKKLLNTIAPNISFLLIVKNNKVTVSKLLIHSHCFTWIISLCFQSFFSSIPLMNKNSHFELNSILKTENILRLIGTYYQAWMQFSFWCWIWTLIRNAKRWKMFIYCPRSSSTGSWHPKTSECNSMKFEHWLVTSTKYKLKTFLWL